MRALVVPTIRLASIKNFLDLWNPIKDWDVTIVVEDNPEKTFDIDVDYHFSWKEIDADLLEDSWIISKRDSAIRSYGFYKAYQIGADYIFTLDDDCLPLNNQKFCQEHINNLEKTSKWCESVLGFRTRGIPYKKLGLLENVVFSMGLWEGVPDFDAVHMLADCIGPLRLTETRVMPRGQYFPFCGMNFAFKKEATPMCLFALMGQGSPFGRFDDIWFGIICKKICDHLNYFITCGKPYIYHSKASDAFNNLVKEAPGIKFNENFWQIVDDIVLTGSTSVDCMNEIGIALEKQDEEYLKKFGKAIQIWSNLFATP
jgi:reversibly glycosylated polypeptide / UDP-arabinopyranose mutase